jgi:hypothetical protein
VLPPHPVEMLREASLTDTGNIVTRSLNPLPSRTTI